jgi:nicotinamidase-related amidase
MKEEYLSALTIEENTGEMLAILKGRNYRPRLWKLIPEKTALLVLDMQDYFLEPGSHAFTPSAPAILPNIEKLIALAINHQMEIICTRHLNDASNAGRMDKWWNDLITEESPMSEIIEMIRREDRKRGGREDGRTGGAEMIKVFIKSQYDAFYNTDLEEYLRSKNIEQVIITGVLANLCCETTARSAFVRGFEVFFPVDATAAYNKEFHLSTFRNLGFGFCPVLTTADLIKSLDNHE